MVNSGRWTTQKVFIRTISVRGKDGRGAWEMRKIRKGERLRC